MNHTRYLHSLIVANGKLYAIGGRSDEYLGLCTAIEEYDPALNKWEAVSHLTEFTLLNNDAPTDQNSLQGNETKSQLEPMSLSGVGYTYGTHQFGYNDINRQVINVKVLVNFLIEGSSEEYSCIFDVANGANLMSLISEAQAQDQWTSEKLKLQMVKLWDAGTKQYNEITQSYDSLTVLDKQKYEFIFKNEEKSNDVTVDVIVNGASHYGLQFNLAVGSSVQLLIDAAFAKFNQMASTGTINFVKVFNSYFEDWVSVKKPYNKMLIDLACTYSISINYSDTSTASNGTPAQDLTKQPITAPIETTNSHIPAPSTSEMNAPVSPNGTSFADQPSAQTNTTLPYSQEETMKDEENNNRATATSTPSGIVNIDQMSGPNGTKPKKRKGARRVANVKELKDPLELAIAKCRPYVEKRKPRVNLKDKDQQKEQNKKNALINKERFYKRNEENVNNLIDLCKEKTNEYSTIHKRCSEISAMEQELEVNFRNNRTKAMNFVNELTAYCYLNENDINRLNQHRQFSNDCTLEENNDIAMEVEYALGPVNSSQADGSAEYREISKIGSCPSENKKAKKKLSEEERKKHKKDSDRRASARYRDKEKNTIVSLEGQIKEKWNEIAEIKDSEKNLIQVYNEKLNKAQDCILPLCDWVHYLLNIPTQQIHVARRDQIATDIKEIRETFDVKPLATPTPM